MKKLILLLIILLAILSSCTSNKVSFDKGTRLSESGTKLALQQTDLNPNNSNQVLLIYNHTFVSSTWDGVTYNREHVWLDSLLETNEQKRDLHNIRACLPYTNGTLRDDRLFKDFEDGGLFRRIGGDYQFFYPGEDDQGDVARIVMYMIKVYNLQVEDIGLDNETLIKWHEADPVDQFEIKRNNVIAQTDMQGNRNPFIDNSELAYKYFVDETSSYLGMIWGTGLVLSIVGIIVVYSVNQIQNKDNIAGFIVIGFILFSGVCGFIWNWWVMLLIIGTITVASYLYYYRE